MTSLESTGRASWIPGLLVKGEGADRRVGTGGGTTDGCSRRWRCAFLPPWDGGLHRAQYFSVLTTSLWLNLQQCASTNNQHIQTYLDDFYTFESQTGSVDVRGHRFTTP